MKFAVGLRQYVEPTAACVTYVAFVLYVGLACFKETWGGDHALYLAALHSLYIDFLSPAHETLPISGRDSHLFSPYIVAVAAVGRVLGMSEYSALQYAGAFNLVCFVGSVFYFFRSFSLVQRSWFPPTIFLLVSTLLVDRYYHWSSELFIRSIVTNQPYPSFLAWAVALASFAFANDFLKDDETWKIVGVAALIWFVLLTHPLTGSWIIGSLGVLGITAFAQGRSKKRVLAMYAGVLLGALTTFGWPYMNLVDLIGNAVVIEENPPFLDEPFETFGSMYLFSIPCAVVLLYARKHLFLVLGFWSTFIAYLFFARFLEVEFAGRYIFFQAFFVQVAIAEIVSLGLLRTLRPEMMRYLGLMTAPQTQKIALVFSCLVIVAAILSAGVRDAVARHRIKSPWTLIQAASAHDAYHARFLEWRQFIAEGDLLIAPIDSPNEVIVAGTGGRVVANRHAHGAADYNERIQNVRLFFAQDTTFSEREQLIRTYDVRWILLYYPEPQSLETFGVQFGFPVLRTEEWTLFRATDAV